MSEDKRTRRKITKDSISASSNEEVVRDFIHDKDRSVEHTSASNTGKRQYTADREGSKPISNEYEGGTDTVANRSPQHFGRSSDLIPKAVNRGEEPSSGQDDTQENAINSSDRNYSEYSNNMGAEAESHNDKQERENSEMKSQGENSRDNGNEREEPSNEDRVDLGSKDLSKAQPNRQANDRISLPTGAERDSEPQSANDSNAEDKASKMQQMGESIKNKMTNNTEEVEDDTVNKAQRAINNTQKVAQSVSSAGSALITILMNPITWIIFFILFGMAVLYSGNQLLGQSDFANNCSPSGSISVNGSVFAGDEKERANAFGHWLTTTKFESLDGKSFSKEDAAAIVGNAHHESKVSSVTMEGEMAWGDDSQKYKTYDNEKVLSEWGETYHHAVGLVQWDGIRRVRLVNYAKSKGKQWHDINIQLEFLEDELNKGYAGVVRQLVAAKGVEAKTEVWRTKFEVGAQASGRLGFAKEFMSFFDGGSGGGFGKSSGSVANCTGGGNVDVGEIIQLAIDISYPMSDYSSSRLTCGPGYDGCGKPESKSGYVQAKEIAEQNGGKDPLGALFASCDRLVATLLKATKKDVDIPWGSTYNQASYLESSPKWQKISCTDRKPGDVLIVPGKHIMMYLGQVEGQDSLASASYRERTAAIGPMDGCSGSYFLADGYTNAVGYRLKE